MDASEPKSVNSISNIIGVNSLRFGGFQQILKRTIIEMNKEKKQNQME